MNSKQPISTEQCARPRRGKAREGGAGEREKTERERSCFDAAKGLKEKRKEELLRGTQRKSCKYATGKLPTISKDLRFQNHREGYTDLHSGF